MIMSFSCVIQKIIPVVKTQLAITTDNWNRTLAICGTQVAALAIRGVQRDLTPAI